MKQSLTKRIVCAALAAEMLLTPAVQAFPTLSTLETESGATTPLERFLTGNIRDGNVDLRLVSLAVDDEDVTPVPASEQPAETLPATPEVTPEPEPSAEIVEVTPIPVPTPSIATPAPTTTTAVVDPMPTPSPAETPPPAPTPTESATAVTEPEEATSPAADPALSSDSPAEPTASVIEKSEEIKADADKLDVEETLLAVDETVETTDETNAPAAAPAKVQTARSARPRLTGAAAENWIQLGDSCAVVYAAYGFGLDYNDGTQPGTKLRYNYEGDVFKSTRTNASVRTIDANSNPINVQIDGTYAQTFTQDSGAFKTVDDKIYFNAGMLPTLPRLPDKEFSNTWYVVNYNVLNQWVGKNKGSTFQRSTFANYASSNFMKELEYLDSQEDDSTYSSKLFVSSDDGYMDWMDTYQYKDKDLYNITTTAHSLMVIAKWNVSSNATATDLNLYQKGSSEALTLYPVSTTNTVEMYSTDTLKNLSDRAHPDVDVQLSNGTTKFFARVGADVSDLTFDLTAYEPGSTLDVKVYFGGTDDTYMTRQLKFGDNSSSDSRVVANALQREERGIRKGGNSPTNSETNPARGIWTQTTGSQYTIPLQNADATTKVNQIDFKVTAPNGNTKTYTVYVQRMAVPVLEMKPGNTPVGMILGETSTAWGQRQTALDSFTTATGSRRFRDQGVNLAPPSSNGGFVWKEGAYQVAAWGQTTEKGSEGDIDLDPAAIVVYQNENFLTPGVTIIDGLGTRHENGAGLGDSFGWELSLTSVTKLGPKTAEDGVTGATWTESGKGAVPTISLIEENIKPGVYTLSYTYTDAYDGQTYNASNGKRCVLDQDGTWYLGKTDTGLKRTVVVLPLRGDVDMDGAVTVADGILLQQLIDAGYFNDVKANDCTDVAKCLYYYRVCDVVENNGSGVDTNDVAELLKGYSPRLQRDSGASGYSDYFYLPLGKGIQSRPSSVSEASGTPAISMKYLGVGTNVNSLDPSKRVDFYPIKEGQALNAAQIFWVGIYIDSPAGWTDSLNSLTVTLTYDPDYVTPYNTDGDWVAYLKSVNNQWSGWTVQSDSKVNITPMGHFSKAPPRLDQTSESKVKELRFTVTGSGTTLGDLASTGVLKIPFTLLGMPSGKATKTAKLVELTLGMRDLTLTTTTKSAAWNASAATVPTSVTTNLTKLLNYAGSEPVKLGEDKTPCAIVYTLGSTVQSHSNPIYGDEYTETGFNRFGISTADGTRVNFPSGSSVEVVEGRLPSGLTYNAERQYISGTPAEAGTFDFKLTGEATPFRIIVDPAVVTVKVGDVTKYYGEPLTKPGGTINTTEQTFTYKQSDIKPRDWKSGSSPGADDWGTAEELATLIEVVKDGNNTYSVPKIELAERLDSGGAVAKVADANTVPGDYIVRISNGSSANYVFRYVQADGAVSEDYGTAKLTVKPRPIQIGKVIKNPVKEIRENASPDTYYANEIALLDGEKTAEFTFADVPVGTDGCYEEDGLKIPLTNTAAEALVGSDQLEIKYTVQVNTSGGNDVSGTNAKFVLTADEEPRTATITVVTLPEKTLENDRYKLISTVPTNTTATAKVIKRVLDRVQVFTMPNLSYTYGDTLTTDGLAVRKYYTDSTTPEEQTDKLSNIKAIGFSVHWVDEKVAPTENSPEATDGQALAVSEYRDGEYIGRYLCFSIGDKMDWAGPFTVKKKDLEVTIAAKDRYYGEDVENKIGSDTDNQWVVSYKRGQLAKWDDEKTTKYPITAALSLDDLKALPGYRPPEIKAVKTASLSGAEVNAGTDAGDYYVVISGGESKEYRFVFTQTDYTKAADGKSYTETPKAQPSESFGYARLTVHQRPILVTEIKRLPRAIYHDALYCKLPDPTYDATPVTASYSSNNNLSAFIPAQPKKSDGSKNTAYYDRNKTLHQITMPLSGNAVYGTDSLTVSFTADLKTDTNIPGFYFNMGDQSFKQVDATISDLTLLPTGKGQNYVLVFPAYDQDANGSIPWTEVADNGWAVRDEGAKQYTSVDSTFEKIGLVNLRKITSIAIIQKPSKSLDQYTYGDTLDLRGLAVYVFYGGNNPEPVVWETLVEGGVTTDSFAKLGLTVNWGTPSNVGDPVERNEQLSVTKHNGVGLVVTGPQYSDGTTATPASIGTVKVAKRGLTLYVVNQTRTYGDNNDIYQFRFPASELATWDRTILNDGRYLTTGPLNETLTANVEYGTGTASGSAALEAINANHVINQESDRYVSPTFKTDAVARSNVGTYLLSLEGGSMANYAFNYLSGSITVSPREIEVAQVTKTPVYSIAKNDLSNNSVTTVDVTCYEGVFVDSGGQKTEISDELSLYNSSLLDGDGVAISVKVQYEKSDTYPMSGESYSISRTVQITGLTLESGVASGGNYKLKSSTPQTSGASGDIHNRDIASIAIETEPGKMTYTYGDTLDLNGMWVVITYADGGTARVQPGSMSGIFVNYVSAQERTEIAALTGAGEIDTRLRTQTTVHPATQGDHLTRAETDGFAHDGKYLMVSAQSAKDSPFVKPVFSDHTITVEQRELAFVVTPVDKVYNTTAQGAGSIRLKAITEDLDHGVYGTDKVEASGTFTFTDPNVKWGTAQRDNYQNLQDIPVRVTGITLTGDDSDNYKIVGSVAANAAGTIGLADVTRLPQITPAVRPAPDTGINLWVDVNTNTVVVEPVKAVSEFYVTGDSYNNQLHYEYNVIYLDENNVMKETGYQELPYFGGEKVILEGGYNNDGTLKERPAGTGLGQSTVEGDTEFDTRGVTNQLPRGTYVAAVVRLSPTNNYQVSGGTASVSSPTPAGYARDIISTDAALKSDLSAAVDVAVAGSDAYPKDPGNEKDRLIERDPGPVIKTYTYRIDLVSTAEEKGTDGKDVITPILEEVWFTDIAVIKDDKAMDRLINNTDPALYYGYYWDAKQNTKVEFGEEKFDLSKDLYVKLPEEENTDDGESSVVVPTTKNEAGETLMNAGGTVRFYVPVVRRGGGSVLINPETVTIIPSELLLREGDDPVQLELEFTPLWVMNKQVFWTSSDESVVTVSRKGEVTIVGPGYAEITVTTFNDITDTIPVRVLGLNEELSPYTDTMFDVANETPYMEVDEDGLFHPQDTMTRHELIVIMEHFFRTVTSIQPTQAALFDDVPGDAAYAEQVKTLDAWGIVEGVGHNLFAPDWTATRAEAATILCRMLMLPVNTDPDGPHAFADAGPEDTWAWPYIDALAAAGITNGTGGGNFSPNRAVTRAELATFIARILITKTDINVENLIIPADVPEGYWAHDAILRAVNSGAVLLYTDPKKREAGTE